MTSALRFYYGETRIGQGRDNVKMLFSENKELANEIEAKLIDAMNGIVSEEISAPPVTEEEPAVRPRKKINIDIAVDD